MALEDLIGSLYGINTQLPLQYGSLYSQAYNPYFSYLGNQAGNMASLGSANMGQVGQMGQQGMNLYGQLAGQQAQMYQTELPMQMEMAKFNALAPVLGGLLGQGGFGGLPGIGQLSMNFNRPDVMSGYQGAVDRGFNELKGAYGSAVGNTRSYDNTMSGAFADMMDKMPTAPYMSRGNQQPQQQPQMVMGSRGLAPQLDATGRPIMQQGQAGGAYKFPAPKSYGPEMWSQRGGRS